jgi:hypothetical protein
MLLPDAERALGERRLAELGVAMTRRRFELAAPRAGEIAVNTVRTFPAATLAMGGMFVLGAFLIGRALTRPNGHALFEGPTLPDFTPDKVRQASRSVVGRMREALAV